MIDQIAAIVGPKNVLTGADAAPYGEDITGMWQATPAAVARPASTQEVSDLIKLANTLRLPVIPVGGRSGLTRGGIGDGVLILSFERMAAIREIRPEARIAVVEAGAILSDIHDAAEAQNLVFPLTFGAKGSARVGGFLGTNAGGSNVLRYGNTRDLVLGIEAVLPDGQIVDLMSGLHKNNSGYDLRHLLIGSEGTLGVITAATLKLMPKPGAYATAMIGMAQLSDERIVAVDEWIDFDRVYSPHMEGRWGAGAQPYIFLFSEEGEEAAIDEAFEAINNSGNAHVVAYKAHEMPAHYHLDHPTRGPDLLVVADAGWSLVAPSLEQSPRRIIPGNHGYDNLDPIMGSTLVAAGPRFDGVGMVAPFENVNVYLMIACALGLEPARTDGDPAEVARVTAGRCPAQ